MVLTGKEAAAMVDISAVRTHHCLEDIERIVSFAKQYRFINVHVLPCWVSELSKMLKDVEGVYVGAPVGFPSGGTTTLTKMTEAKQLLIDGVEEMDIVMNVGRFKSGDDRYVLNELREIISMTDKKVKTKVIIETRALTESEIFRACDLVMESGADFVKTGTGWIPGTLDLEQMYRIKKHCGNHIKLKVAGGIRNRQQFTELVEMGVERMGINAESAIEIVEALNKKPYENPKLTLPL